MSCKSLKVCFWSDFFKIFGRLMFFFPVFRSVGASKEVRRVTLRSP